MLECRDIWNDLGLMVVVVKVSVLCEVITGVVVSRMVRVSITSDFESPFFPPRDFGV